MRLLSTRSAPTKAETFLWTSLAKEACVVETDREMTSVPSTPTPGFSPGLVVVQRPDCGPRIRRSMVEIPGHRSTGRRGGEPSRQCECPSPRSPHALDDASLDELRREWRRLYRSEPPRISRDLLIRGIGYRRQEIQHGGLGKSTRRKLKTLAKMFRTEGRVAPDPGLSLKPGARLVREWHGRTHTSHGDRGRIRVCRDELSVPHQNRQKDHGSPLVGSPLLRSCRAGQQAC